MSQRLASPLGLSPRVRGNPRHAGRPLAYGGSIPACAGEPLSSARLARCLRVYPRVCGEPQSVARDDLTAGSIPRVCGGTSSSRSGRAERYGLSPRVRGNRKHQPRTGPGIGSIPACAGEPTPGAAQQKRRPGLSPRVRGTLYRAPGHRLAIGLSPRVRGNRIEGQFLAHVEGSIPACAGEPTDAEMGWRSGTVYPRVCGGTVYATRAAIASAGLSPRVRGNPDGTRRADNRWGSIPACAGEPTCSGSPSWAGRVYPRVCGGTNIIPGANRNT